MFDWPLLSAVAICWIVFAIGAVWAFRTAKKDDGTETWKDDDRN